MKNLLVIVTLTLTSPIFAQGIANNKLNNIFETQDYNIGKSSGILRYKLSKEHYTQKTYYTGLNLGFWSIATGSSEFNNPIVNRFEDTTGSIELKKITDGGQVIMARLKINGKYLGSKERNWYDLIKIDGIGPEGLTGSGEPEIIVDLFLKIKSCDNTSIEELTAPIFNLELQDAIGQLYNLRYQSFSSCEMSVNKFMLHDEIIVKDTPYYFARNNPNSMKVTINDEGLLNLTVHGSHFKPANIHNRAIFNDTGHIPSFSQSFLINDSVELESNPEVINAAKNVMNELLNYGKLLVTNRNNPERIELIQNAFLNTKEKIILENLEFINESYSVLSYQDKISIYLVLNRGYEFIKYFENKFNLEKTLNI